MSDILTRLRGYNTPDRTIDEQKQVSVDIHDAAEEIQSLQDRLEILRDQYKHDQEFAGVRIQALQDRNKLLEEVVKKIANQSTPCNHGNRWETLLLINEWAKKSLSKPEDV